MAKTFASHADLEEKNVTFAQLSEHAWAYTAEGDPNTGIIITDEGVMVIDTQATPAMAQDVINRIREVTDAPIKYVTLSHYHAVRVLGASAYRPDHIIASRDTYDLIVERGQQDMDSEIGRFPRLFNGVETVPGLTWPTITFEGAMSIWMGGIEIQILQLGRGHTKGDTVVWLPSEKVCFSGDLVEYGATPYTGDAYLKNWPATLDAVEALGAEALVPGRGDALTTPEMIADGIGGTRAFVSELLTTVTACKGEGLELGQTYKKTFASMSERYGHWVIFEHCMPFDVTRAYDESGEYVDPRIWTAERDVEMWKSLEEIED